MTPDDELPDDYHMRLTKPGGVRLCSRPEAECAARLDALKEVERLRAEVESLRSQAPYVEASGHYCDGMTEAWSDAQAEICRRLELLTIATSALEAYESVMWMAEKYAEAGGAGGPELRTYREAELAIRALARALGRSTGGAP